MPNLLDVLISRDVVGIRQPVVGQAMIPVGIEAHAPANLIPGPGLPARTDAARRGVWGRSAKGQVPACD